MRAASASAESAVGIADAASYVRGERRGVGFAAGGAGSKLDLALAVHELVEGNEHLYAEIPGHIVTGGATKFANARAGGDDLVGIGDADCRLNVGADFHRAGPDAPLGLQAGDDRVHALDFVGILRLGVVDLHEAGPDGGVEVRFHQVVIDAADRVGAALVHHRDGLANQIAGDVLEIRRDGVLEVHVDEVAAAMPGVVDEARRDDGHRQAGALQSPRCAGHGELLGNRNGNAFDSGGLGTVADRAGVGKVDRVCRLRDDVGSEHAVV